MMSDSGIFRSMCLGGKVAMVAGGDDDGALGAIAIVHPA